MAKSGDSVRVIGNSTNHKFPIKKVLTLICATDDDFKATDGVNFDWISEQDFIVIEKPKATNKPTYNE